MRAWLKASSRVALAAAAIGVASLGACTQDFDSFYVDADAGSMGGSGQGGAAGSSAGAAGGSAGSASGGDAGAAGSGGASGSAGMAGTGGTGACDSGFKACGGECVAADDPAYGCTATGCDPCGVPNATAACSAGACTINTCDTGFADCNTDAGDGCEINLANDVSNCGACDRGCALPHASARCENSQCEVDSCDAGYTNCDNDPSTGCDTNTDSDPRACGSCVNDCFASSGNWTCKTGTCELSSCPTGFADCDGTGCNTNTQTSLSDCGFCDNACAPANATGTCIAGECKVLSCDSGFADCDNNPDNGCERNLKTDPDNCGTCGRACSSSGVATRACSNGVCAPSCSSGMGDCSSPAAPSPDNGCETNLGTSPDNCGVCNRACSSVNTQTRLCMGGTCAPICNSGFGDCTTPTAPAADNGCEVSTSTDALNCGGCGRTCSTSGVQTLVCTAGLCTSTCTGTKGNCNRPAAPAPDDGCEAELSTNLDNCGTCGRACSGTNVATRVCSGGSCTSTCQAGFGNCLQPPGAVADDGCEANLNTSADNCGACGRACSYANTTTRSCNAGLCNSICGAGFGNCTQPAAPANDNGCESILASDPQNCGACGRPCSTSGTSSTSCSGGLCNSPCSTGRGNCTQPAAPSADDGCEIDTLTDTRNCGACGRGCSSDHVLSKSCSFGVCNSTCDVGYGNCAQPPTGTDDGCETNVSANASSCGACGEGCVSGFVCGSSTCGCDSNGDCNAGGNATCSSGICECSRIGADQVCKPGERCINNSGQSTCSCNGGSGCGSGQTCCESGCKNLSSDATSCGACGHTCPPGFNCASSSCVCNGDASCNAGSAGTCSSNVCHCGATTCGPGERCQPGGTCG
ncbi:MAG: hypothetical protein AB7S68_14885 [Polyangiaceae bacterium]